MASRAESDHAGHKEASLSGMPHKADYDVLA